MLDVNMLERVKICSATFSQIIADSGAYQSRLSEIKVCETSTVLDSLLSMGSSCLEGTKYILP